MRYDHPAKGALWHPALRVVIQAASCLPAAVNGSRFESLT